MTPKTDDTEHGLAFDFLADEPTGGENSSRVTTGHNEGVITVNVAEADDAEREKRRLALHEPYRTLLGHFRHESGHYYWDRLVRKTPWLEQFRKLFGDERDDYSAALERHYEQGPPADWQERFVSAYASSHPWEDWAETWAHYLHMTDTLETASECGLALLPSRAGMPAVRPRSTRVDRESFASMMKDWFAVTYVLNNLNRGLGQKDSYPFVLSAPAAEKLRFVHEVCANPIDKSARERAEVALARRDSLSSR